MGERVGRPRFWGLSRLVLVSLIAGGSAACSSDALRFSEPFANPFSSLTGEPSTTGSLPSTPRETAAHPAPRLPVVQSQPLAPPAATAARVPAPVAAPAPIAAAPAIAPAPRPAAPVASGPGGWSAQGGTPITVAQGDGLNQIATRFGVPASAILSANGLSSAGQVTPGRQLVIPVYSAAGQAAAPAPRSAPVAQAPKPVEAPVARAEPEAKRHPRPGQATAEAKAKPEPKQAAKPEPKPEPKVAKVEPKPAPKPEPKQAKVETTHKLKPEPKTAKVEPKPAPKPEPKVAKVEPKPAAKPEPKPEPKVAKVEPKPAPKPEPKAAKVEPKPAKPEPKVAEAPKPALEAPKPALVAEAPKPEPAKPSAAFRWPAHGRVINGYGSGGNEGINIAVPEGTPVKAAEDGTVAYAGSDVKGYGKLVLVRHPNGYVSAYAHNGELDVKPGEKVRRGQTIAKSGQSGNVTSPQLHFEIRSGATPVDPMQHLASN